MHQWRVAWCAHCAGLARRTGLPLSPQLLPGDFQRTHELLHASSAAAAMRHALHLAEGAVAQQLAMEASVAIAAAQAYWDAASHELSRLSPLASRAEELRGAGAVSEGTVGAVASEGAGAVAVAGASERGIEPGVVEPCGAPDSGEAQSACGSLSASAPTSESASEGAASEKAASEGAVSENAASEGAVSEDAVSEGAASEGAVSEDSVSDAACQDAVRPPSQNTGSPSLRIPPR